MSVIILNTQNINIKGENMARANFVKKARKDYPEHGIKKGESYYWWKFNFSKTRHFSKTSPTRTQLTHSGFLQSVYAIEDRINEFQSTSSLDSIEGDIEDTVNEIENLKDECKESLGNMPEALQESSSSGQMLAERIEALENWVSELQGIDLGLEDLNGEDTTKEDKDKLRDERFGEIIGELSDCYYQG